jgi:hypothetical protein
MGAGGKSEGNKKEREKNLFDRRGSNHGELLGFRVIDGL